MKRLLLLLLFLTGIAPAVARPQSQGPLVLAAASLQEAMTAAGHAWAAQGHAEPVLSFAASSALARQITAGAPADLFVSADQAWMDDVAAKGLLVQGTRAPFLGNRLVIVAAVGNPVKVPLASAALVRLLAAGPLAMADAPVPAGRYAEAVLRSLGVWTAVAPRVVRGDSVRAALVLVERGAAPLGIVYATDARASSMVRIAGVFPASSHPAITYPIARIAGSRNPEGEAFRRFLVSAKGKAIFVRYGFTAR